MSAVLSGIGMVTTVAASDEAQRLAGVMVHAGLLLVRGVVLYGLFVRAGWALWLGGLFSIMFLPVPLLNGIRIEASAVAFELTGVSLALAWLTSAAGVLFLAGLAWLGFDRRRERG